MATNKKDKLYFSFVESDYTGNTSSSFVISQEFIDTVQHSINKTNLFICGCYHSHTTGLSYPSRTDVEAKKQTNDFWLIYSFRENLFSIYKWDGKRFRKQFFKIV